MALSWYCCRWSYKTGIEFDPEAAEAAKQRETQLQKEKENEDAKMIKWIDAVFGDAYVAYTHLKALSTFVEAVLRYGLAHGQPDYVAYLVWVRPTISNRFYCIVQSLLWHS